MKESDPKNGAGAGTEAGAGGDDKKQKGKTTGIADYLSAPRKKRKSFVVLALGKGMKPDMAGGITAFVRTNFKTFAMAQAKTIEELRKHFTRQVVLLVFDDEFTDLEQGLELVAELKQKKSNTVVPVLFLTRNPELLIDTYNKRLLAFHEADEYLNYPKVPMTHVLSKVRAGLANRNRRRSRRYKVDTPVAYLSLSDDAQLPGKLLDLSIHGALVKAEEGKIFRLGDQLKLHLPISGYLPPVEGEFLKISARVRRVFISGSLAGVSFEHVTEKQLLTLTRFLTEMVNAQTVRRAVGARPRATQLRT
jgi:hypothetical protein